MTVRWIVARRLPVVKHIKTPHDYAPLCVSSAWRGLGSFARDYAESRSKATDALPLCGDCRRKAQRIAKALLAAEADR